MVTLCCGPNSWTQPPDGRRVIRREFRVDSRERISRRFDREAALRGILLRRAAARDGTSQGGGPGGGPAETFLSVHLPLLQGPLLAEAMRLFIDLLKEPPLTLFLRPANFETLATSAYGQSTKARLEACAVPSLLIALTGGFGLVIMNRWLFPAEDR